MLACACAHHTLHVTGDMQYLIVEMSPAAWGTAVQALGPQRPLLGGLRCRLQNHTAVQSASAASTPRPGAGPQPCLAASWRPPRSAAWLGSCEAQRQQVPWAAAGWWLVAASCPQAFCLVACRQAAAGA